MSTRVPAHRESIILRIPPAFDPSFSLLGRAIRRAAGDPLRAEALFILALAAVVLGLVGLHYAAWLLAGQNSGNDALSWTVQISLLVLCAAVCIPGWKPAVTVTCGRHSLAISQGKRRTTVRYPEITSVTTASGLLYYRHYRRYNGTVPYVNRVGDQVLLLHTPEAVIALGLSQADCATLHALLAEQRTPAPLPSPSVLPA